ncbi:hypothetical protein HK098_007147 [Nowakowskiella sp. JEL0407]|nr:hypothetical protein HK098_007147 [Nowakowskiella sp. JEL0407]
MKHGIRFWQKKMSRKASHRKALLRSLISQLIIHEKITTTVAKAKFLKHAAEELINKAKLQTPQSDRIAHATLYSHSITLPKLKTTLVERYKNQLGGYIRILRYGFNSPGSDRAPKAIVELVGHAKDTVKLLASEGNRLSAVQKSLQEIEQEKYKKTGVILVDPFTRVAEEFALMRVREDLPGKVMKGLNVLQINHTSLQTSSENKMSMLSRVTVINTVSTTSLMYILIFSLFSFPSTLGNLNNN